MVQGQWVLAGCEGCGSFTDAVVRSAWFPVDHLCCAQGGDRPPPPNQDKPHRKMVFSSLAPACLFSGCVLGFTPCSGSLSWNCADLSAGTWEICWKFSAFCGQVLNQKIASLASTRIELWFQSVDARDAQTGLWFLALRCAFVLVTTNPLFPSSVGQLSVRESGHKDEIPDGETCLFAGVIECFALNIESTEDAVLSESITHSCGEESRSVGMVKTCSEREVRSKCGAAVSKKGLSSELRTVSSG